MEIKSSLAYTIRSAYEEFDSFTDKLKITNMCIPHCNVCCRDYFNITEYEFLYLLKYIEENKMDKSKYIFLSRQYANCFKTLHSNKFIELESYMATAEQIMADNDAEYFNDLPLCIFWNERNGCSVYQARPSVCRWYGSCAPCRLIGNPNVGKVAASKLATLTSSVYNKKSNKIISFRTYPLFYWFYKFLSPEYREVTNIKVKAFSFSSEENFSALELKFIQH
ncbi:MAG TPA: YkgJ family cysteine cluster protein [Caproicibacter sp.]|nr:YkgJ family cysteine cluster protein [Caproicibacter sp.]